MMKKILPLLLLGLPLVLWAQSPRFDFQLHLGVSDITYDYDLDVGTAFTNPAFSFAAGFGLEFELSQRAALGFKLMYSQVNGVEGGDGQQLFLPNATTGEPELAGILDYERDIRFNYLAIPVFYHYKHNRFGIQLGWQTMVFLGGSSSIEGQVETPNGLEIVDSGRISASEDTDTFDFGPHLGLSFDITEVIRLHFTGYVGIVDNTPDTATTLESSNRQYLLGVSFKL